MTKTATRLHQAATAALRKARHNEASAVPVLAATLREDDKLLREIAAYYLHQVWLDMRGPKEAGGGASHRSADSQTGYDRLAPAPSTGARLSHVTHDSQFMSDPAGPPSDSSNGGESFDSKQELIAFVESLPDEPEGQQ